MFQFFVPRFCCCCLCCCFVPVYRLRLTDRLLSVHPAFKKMSTFYKGLASGMELVDEVGGFYGRKALGKDLSTYRR